MSIDAFVTAAVLVVVLALCGSVLVYQLVTGVPPMSSSAVEDADVVALLRQAGIAETAVIYELGSGWGTLVIALARAFPHAEIRGIELSPLPYWVSRFRTRKFNNVHLRRQDIFRCDLADAQAVTCYLMVRTLPKLAEFLDRSIAPGTPVVSLSFWFRGREVAASLENAGPLGAAALYYWPARSTRGPTIS